MVQITLYYTLPLTITIDDKTTTYNGDTQFGYSTSLEDILDGRVHVDGLWGNDSVAEYNYQPASGKDADTYTGSFTATPVVKNGDDTVTYYNITTTPGKLIIEPAEITVAITGNNDTKTYNGENQTEGFDYEVTELPRLTSQ